MPYIAIVLYSTLCYIKEMLNFLHLEGIAFTVKVNSFSLFQIGNTSIYYITLYSIILCEDIKGALSFTTKVIKVEFVG